MLSIEDLKNKAKTVINDSHTPVHVGSGDQITTTDDTSQGSGVNVIEGDNPGGIRQTFRR